MIGGRPNLDELDREIRDHLDAETEDNVARGMSADEARAAALRKFGNVTRVKESVREVWVPGWLDRARQDARDAVRHVRRNPGFALTIAATLALGIGLTTAIYSVVNAVLLRPLSYPHPERVVWMTTRDASGREGFNSLDFGTWQPAATSFDHMVAYGFADATLVASGDASRIRILSASTGFWDLTGARPLLGALPEASERDVLVLSHRAYRDRFQADPNVIGRAVTLDGQQATIGAVLPDDYAPQLPAFAWRPGLDQAEVEVYRGLVTRPAPKTFGPDTQVAVYLGIGRLKPGVSVQQAQGELSAVHGLNQQAYPEFLRGSAAIVTPLHQKLVGPSRTALGLLLAAALCVLLITVANVANLLMSRSGARQKEIALRMSVGGGPLRVVRQLLAESLAYAVLGGIAGVLVASWLVNLVIGVIGPAVPRLAETTLDWRVLGFATATSLVTALLFGIGPAVALGRTNVQDVLKEGARSASASRRRLFAGRAMIAMQLALTIVVVTGAGLMVKSVWRLTSHPAGFTPEQILTMRVDFTGPAYRDDRARHVLAEALLARARSLPGVRGAAITTDRGSLTIVMKEGEPMPADRERHGAPISAVSPGFGPLLGMSLVRGRWFEEVEPQGAVLINEALARREYPGVDPIGRRLRMPWAGAVNYSPIVGVVADLKYAELDADAPPELFVHHAQSRLFGVTLALRVDGDPLAAAPEIRKALSAIDPTQSIFGVRTMAQVLAETIAPRRFNLLLLGTFAVVALLLAALGVYGVVAYAVAGRTHEIGIRLALGAERRGVVGMIVRQGMASVVAGIGVGLLSALAASRLMASLLYGVEPTDAPTFAIVTALVTVVGVLACATPALRAALVNPVVALRAE